MLDNGTIDANGVARTNSPPFPGLNKNGQIMIARASQPMQQVRIDATGQLTFIAMNIAALGFSATGGVLGTAVQAGFVGSLLLLAVPYALESIEAAYYANLRNGEVKVDTVTLTLSLDDRKIRKTINLPPSDPLSQGEPHIFREADHVVSPFNPRGAHPKGVEVHFT